MPGSGVHEPHEPGTGEQPQQKPGEESGYKGGGRDDQSRETSRVMLGESRHQVTDKSGDPRLWGDPVQ